MAYNKILPRPRAESETVLDTGGRRQRMSETRLVTDEEAREWEEWLSWVSFEGEAYEVTFGTEPLRALLATRAELVEALRACVEQILGHSAIKGDPITAARDLLTRIDGKGGK